MHRITVESEHGNGASIDNGEGLEAAGPWAQHRPKVG